jgi:ribosomal-protein-alanine N-acetyltransferase
MHRGTRILETQRLLLRPFKMEDAADMFNNWASDEAVTRFLSWNTHSNLKDSREILELWMQEYDKKENYNWAIQLKESESVIGSIGLINIDDTIECCEIGYCIGRTWWNKGITTEAFSEIIKFALTEVGFERLTGRHHVDNIASGIVMKKCGLVYEGTLRKIHKINTGMLVDCKYYSILKEEWPMKES